MMGRRRGDQASLFYEFRLDDRIPKDHLLRRIDGFVTAALADVHERLEPYYSEIGRPSVDPELMIRLLIIGYCYGLRSERRLTQEVELHLAYRWFCRLDLDDKVPHHSTFSENRLHRFRESDVFRHIFERVVATCMTSGLVRGEGFAVDASVMEANASRYHGKAEPRDGSGCNGCATPVIVAPRLADSGGCSSCAVQDPYEPIVQQEPRDSSGCSNCALRRSCSE